MLLLLLVFGDSLSSRFTNSCFSSLSPLFALKRRSMRCDRSPGEWGRGGREGGGREGRRERWGRGEREGEGREGRRMRQREGYEKGGEGREGGRKGRRER